MLSPPVVPRSLHYNVPYLQRLLSYPVMSWEEKEENRRVNIQRYHVESYDLYAVWRKRMPVVYGLGSRVWSRRWPNLEVPTLQYIIFFLMYKSYFFFAFQYNFYALDSFRVLVFLLGSDCWCVIVRVEKVLKW